MWTKTRNLSMSFLTFFKANNSFLEIIITPSKNNGNYQYRKDYKNTSELKKIYSLIVPNKCSCNLGINTVKKNIGKSSIFLFINISIFWHHHPLHIIHSKIGPSSVSFLIFAWKFHLPILSMEAAVDKKPCCSSCCRVSSSSTWISDTMLHGTKPMRPPHSPL